MPTLPVLHVLRSPGPADARLLELLRPGELADPALRSEALGLLRAHPAMDMARADTRRWAAAAREDFRMLPAVPARAGFEAICDFVTERTG